MAVKGNRQSERAAWFAGNAERRLEKKNKMEKKKREKTKKDSRLMRGLRLLNPKNLEKEVHVYGYHFSWKAHILLILCSLLGIGAIGVLYQLKPVYFTVVVTAVGLMLPAFVLDMYRRMYEQKRFADAVTYMEQMLYSFQKSGKAVSALKEAQEIFEEGTMHDTIRDAIRYLEDGVAYTEKGVLREAFEKIEDAYPCNKLHAVHELLAGAEEYGGEMDGSILLMLKDTELFKRRGYRLQAQKKTSHTDNIISIVVATILCAVALYVLDAMGHMFPGAGADAVRVFSVETIQISSFLFILLMLFVLVKSNRNLTADWLNAASIHPEDYIRDSYDTVMNYDEAGERKKSLLFAAPFFIAAGCAFFYGKPVLGIPCILLAAFMLMQHKTGYNLAKKDVNDELYLALPQWLMSLALLLQHNNVQVAIKKSIGDAPAVLQPELNALMDRLAMEPDRLKSYTDFCRAFDVPEITSCMKMLHAISESGTGNAKAQIDSLIERVNEMQGMADDIRDRDTAFKMKMIFSYPVLAATVKLLVDLTFGMILMFGMLGSMGGVS